MITTVTLNAAIDKTYYLDQLSTGEVNRTQTVYAVPGGKGLNVARVIKTLGHDALASGIVAGNNGNFICRGLDKEGIRHDFISASSGESRLCLNIIAADTNQSTEILEPGPKISKSDYEAAVNKVLDLGMASHIVVLSGSLPAGLPANTYQTLITHLTAQNALAFLDTSGEALKQGIDAKPFFIKPNKDEALALLGIDDTGDEGELVKAIRQWMIEGIACVVITLGEAGSIAGYDGKCYRVHAPKITPLNTVGCGDAFVAGMAIAFQQSWPIEVGLTFATAASAANALTKHAGEVHESEIQSLKEQVRVEQIE
jgi:tagatose 6-phosphate kinase